LNYALLEISPAEPLPTKEEKTGISNKLKFQSQEELEKDKRQLNDKEVKQRWKLF
jgi:hypothetical protein